MAVLQPVSSRRGPVVLEDPWRGVAKHDDRLVLLPRRLHGPLEPVPLVGRVVVVVVPGHHVALQVEGRVDGHQLQLPPRQVYLVVAPGLEGGDGLGGQPGLPELSGSQVHRLLLLSGQMRERRERGERGEFYYLEITPQNCTRNGGYVIQSTRENYPGQIEFGKIVFFYCCNLPLPCPLSVSI